MVPLIGAIFYNFGPVVLDNAINFWHDANVKNVANQQELAKLEFEKGLAERALQETKLELIRQSVEADRLKQESEQIRRKDIVAQDLQIEILKQLSNELVKRDNKLKPSVESDILDGETTKLDSLQDNISQGSENPIILTNASPNTKVNAFGVFENEKFELCGFDNFQASVSFRDDMSIRLHSSDKRIPDRKFTGFVMVLPLEKVVELWPNCLVAFDYEDLAGVRRIAVSVSGSGS